MAWQVADINNLAFESVYFTLHDIYVAITERVDTVDGVEQDPLITEPEYYGAEKPPEWYQAVNDKMEELKPHFHDPDSDAGTTFVPLTQVNPGLGNRNPYEIPSAPSAYYDQLDFPDILTSGTAPHEYVRWCERIIKTLNAMTLQIQIVDLSTGTFNIKTSSRAGGISYATILSEYNAASFVAGGSLQIQHALHATFDADEWRILDRYRWTGSYNVSNNAREYTWKLYTNFVTNKEPQTPGIVDSFVYINNDYAGTGNTVVDEILTPTTSSALSPSLGDIEPSTIPEQVHSPRVLYGWATSDVSGVGGSPLVYLVDYAHPNGYQKWQ
jgi:hypothetical protein